MENETFEFVAYEFQVDHPNGDISFVTVFDLPKTLCEKFVQSKYPDCKVSFYKTHI